MNTLGLNIIVGAGEAPLLERCMRSLCDGKFFDEIIIVNTSGDRAVEETARRYTDKVLFHQWVTESYPYGNFAAARNAALDASTTDYIWWQDADDIHWPEANEKSFLHIKSVVCDPRNAVDAHFIQYVTAIDKQCHPIVSFQKERIFRRGAARWHRPVHEQLFKTFSGVDVSHLNGVQSVHLPEKGQNESAERNVAILQHELDCGRGDDITRFFLCRDLMMAGQIERGVKEFEILFEEMNLDFDSLFAIALELCYYYAYGKLRFRMSIDDIQDTLETERWLRLALSLSDAFAEPYTILGDLYAKRGNIAAAERLYLAALKKKIGGKKLGLQITPYYRLIPATRLSELYEAGEDYDKALWYNKIALEANGASKDHIDLRLRVLDKLKETTEAMRERICGD